MPTVTQLNVEIGAKLDKLDRGLGQANRKLDGFGNDVNKVDRKLSGFNKTALGLGGTLTGIFAGTEIIRGISNMISDSSRLAAEAQGVENAFNKLNKPGILSELQISTRGTVNNLELMRRAVQANNFKIPLERLGTFFQFATNRAIETGESVDFLVNSIVTGIGRKSPLILDNLGISAAELSAEVKKVGDFGQAAANIIERELASAGDVMDTTKTQTERLTASFDNLKIKLGEIANSGFVSIFLQNLNSDLERLNGSISGRIQNPFDIQRELDELSDYVKFLETIGARQEKVNEVTGQYQRLLKQYPDILQTIRNSFNVPEAQILVPPGVGGAETARIGAIEEINQKIQDVQEKRIKASKKQLGTLNAELELLKKQKKELEFIGTAAQRAAVQQKQLFTEIQATLTELSQPIASPNLGFDFFQNTGGRFNESFISEDILSRAGQLNAIMSELGQNIALAEAKNIAFGGSYDLLGEKLFLTEQAINSLIESGISPQNQAVIDLQSEYERLIQIYDEQNQKLQESARASQEFASVLSTGLNTVFNLLVRNNDEISKFGKILASGVFNVFSTLLTGGNPSVGFLSGIFKGIGSVGSFASGGIAVGPQLAVVGDNPGRREAIIPSELFGKLGRANEIVGEVKIKGNDMYVLLRRQAKLMNRTSGNPVNPFDL